MTARPTDVIETNEEELPEIAGYRSINGLAVGALVLGIFSAFALAHIVLWILPVLTLILGWLAIRRARMTDSGGVGVARLAICLAVLFGTWGVTQGIFTDVILKSKARKVADSWMKLIQEGQLRQAHQWTLTSESRVQDPTLLDFYYEGNNDGKTSFRKFAAKGPMPLLAALPQGTVIENRGLDTWISDGNQDMARFRYAIIMPEKRQEVIVSVMRELEISTRKTHWKVLAVE